MNLDIYQKRLHDCTYHAEITQFMLLTPSAFPSEFLFYILTFLSTKES